MNVLKNEEVDKENNKIDEDDSNIETEEDMAKRKKGFKSDRQRKKVMAKLSESRWITKKYDNISGATFYVPKIKFPELEYPSIFNKPKRKTKK